MQYDWIVVGGGVGGVSVASLLTKESKNGLLLEKLHYLGGCAGTYQTKGAKFNVGASAIMGYEDGMPLKTLCDQIDLRLDMKPLNSGMSVLYKGKEIKRYIDFESFLSEIDNCFAHPNNRLFWEKARKLSSLFWKNCDFYYSKASMVETIKSAYSLKKQLFLFGAHLFDSASDEIDRLLPNISDGYRLFLDEQIRIVAQANAKDVNFLTAALALSYTFYQNYYSFGGMGGVIEQIASKVAQIKLNSEVLRIEPKSSYITVHTKKESFDTKLLFLNTTIFDSHKLFDKGSKLAKKMLNESIKYENVGAFTLYILAASNKKYEHHYQILLDEPLPSTKSLSFFVSYSDMDDNLISNNGEISITISTHTPIDIWLQLPKDEYLRQKEMVTNAILERLYAYFPEIKESVKYLKSGTPKTFERYVNRSSVGGIPLRREYFRLNYPSPDTADSKIFRVGDSVFPGQGVPGVIMGAMNAFRVCKMVKKLS